MRQALLLITLCFLLGCGTSTVNQTSAPSTLKSGDYTGAAIGAFVDGMVNIPSFEAAIGKKLAVVLWYVPWQQSFPTSDADAVEANGSVPLITWEPWLSGSTATLEAIAAGSYESYVTGFLRAAKAWGKPLFLRFAHEMNGNWYPWDGYHNGSANGPDAYKRAWRYIYNVKTSVGADNVILVWCANNRNLPAAAWNDPADYYPGDDYVDWIGMDGYNWGGVSWESFDSVFSQIYSTLTALSDKPLMIGEFSADEQGGNKAAWITEAFSRIQAAYPRIKIFCWFNINKERDWRIDSSPASETAMRNALQNDYFLARIQ